MHNNRLTLRVNVSPSTITGIEGSGQDQPFGQNAYSRTSEQTYRDVAGVVKDTWTIGSNKVNEFTFQYARRGLSYFYNTAIPGGSDPAIKFPVMATSAVSPTPTFSASNSDINSRTISPGQWAVTTPSSAGTLTTYPLTAIFTVNYGGVYDFGPFSSSWARWLTIHCRRVPAVFPELCCSSLRRRTPRRFRSRTRQSQRPFHNIPIGVFWQDSWHVRPNVTLNLGCVTTLKSRRSSNQRTPAGASWIQLSRTAEGHSDRQQQHSAALRHRVGSEGRRQNGAARLIWNVL